MTIHNFRQVHLALALNNAEFLFFPCKVISIIISSHYTEHRSIDFIRQVFYKSSLWLQHCVGAGIFSRCVTLIESGALGAPG